MLADSLGVVVAHDDHVVTRQIAELLEATPGLFVAATSLEAARPGQVVVAGGEVLVTTRACANPLVALASGDAVRAARAALAAGARDLVRWPEESERLPAAIRRALAETTERRGDGTIVAVLGARGGAGTSAVTVLLAAALGECLVLDLDLVGAGQRAFAPTARHRTLYELSLADLSPDALASSVVEHPGGARALHGQPFGDALTLQEVNGLLRAARVAARFTIIDCGRGATEAAHRAAEQADTRVIVAADDMASIRGVRALTERGCADAVIILRRERRRGISLRDLIAAFGRRPVAIVRTRHALARAIDLGTLPERIPKQIARLAEELEGSRER